MARVEVWLRTALVVFAIGAAWGTLRTELRAMRAEIAALQRDVAEVGDYAVLKYRVEQLEKRGGAKR